MIIFLAATVFTPLKLSGLSLSLSLNVCVCIGTLVLDYLPISAQMFR